MLNRKNELTSLAFWYPKVKDLGIRTPKTILVPCNRVEILDDMENERPINSGLISEIASAAVFVGGYPVFLRTDLSSGKHDWKNTCFLQNEQSIERNLFNLIACNELADLFGLPYKYIVVREFLKLETSFIAFPGQMPINKERRYFIENGGIVCHHPYWPEEAFDGRVDDPNCDLNWRNKLPSLNQETPEETELLTICAKTVSRALPGFWSVDFAQTVSKDWYLIDMAVGEASYHWPTCQNAHRQQKGI